MVRGTYSKPAKMFEMLSAIFPQCPAKVLHGSETEAMVPNEDFWFKGPGTRNRLKFRTHRDYKNYGLWSEGRGILCLNAHFSWPMPWPKKKTCLNHFLDFKITDNFIFKNTPFVLHTLT